MVSVVTMLRLLLVTQTKTVSIRAQMISSASPPPKSQPAPKVSPPKVSLKLSARFCRVLRKGLICSYK